MTQVNRNVARFFIFLNILNITFEFCRRDIVYALGAYLLTTAQRVCPRGIGHLIAKLDLNVAR
jgi:hypothetical protein